MVVKTLVTDDFDEGGHWMDADDKALLHLTVHGIVEKALRRIRERDEARKVEPADMTVMRVVDCPDGMARIWARNDAKRKFKEGLTDLRRWQCEGEREWRSWDHVLFVTEGYDLIPLFEKGCY